MYKIKLLSAFAALALSSVCLGACGGSSKASDPATTATSAALPPEPAVKAPRVAPRGTYLRFDNDTDSDDMSQSSGPSGDDEGGFSPEGTSASPSDTRAISAVVKSYYAASAALDAAKACALLDPGLASGVAESQDRTNASGAHTCVASFAPLLRQQHAQLTADEPATMTVMQVRAHGDAGIAKVGFRAAPEDEIILHRNSGAWKIDALFGSELP